MPLWLDPPRPSTGAPPAVADSSSKGAMPGYALEDHTHASKARKDRKTVTTGQPFTWVYPTPFAAGVEPLPFGQARVPSASTDIYNVQTIGTPGNLICVMQVNRTSLISAGLLGVGVSVQAAASATQVTVDLLALEP